MSIYDQIYDLLVTYVYGGGSEQLNSMQTLAATQIATLMSTFVAMIPTILFSILIAYILRLALR